MTRVSFPFPPNSTSHLVRTPAASYLQMAFTPEIYSLDSFLESAMHFQKHQQLFKSEASPKTCYLYPGPSKDIMDQLRMLEIQLSNLAEIRKRTQMLLRVCLLSSFSCAWLFATLWIVAHQSPHPRDSPGRNTGGGCHTLLQGIFPTQGLNLCLLHFLHWQAVSLPPLPPGKPIDAPKHSLYPYIICSDIRTQSPYQISCIRRESVVARELWLQRQENSWPGINRVLIAKLSPVNSLCFLSIFSIWGIWRKCRTICGTVGHEKIIDRSECRLKPNIVFFIKRYCQPLFYLVIPATLLGQDLVSLKDHLSTFSWLCN